MIDHKLLCLAFLRPYDDDFFMNRVTAKVSQHPYHHVELFFPCKQSCFSVVLNECAGFRAKNLSNPMYDMVTLAVTPDEYNKCLAFCDEASKQKIEFDNHGMYMSYFKIPCCKSSSMSRKRTFCSKIITEALKTGGLDEVSHLDPSCTTPSRLFDAVKNSRRFVCGSVPYKINAMLQTPVILSMNDERSNRRP